MYIFQLVPCQGKMRAARFVSRDRKTPALPYLHVADTHPRTVLNRMHMEVHRLPLNYRELPDIELVPFTSCEAHVDLVPVRIKIHRLPDFRDEPAYCFTAEDNAFLSLDRVDADWRSDVIYTLDLWRTSPPDVVAYLTRVMGEECPIPIPPYNEEDEDEPASES